MFVLGFDLETQGLDTRITNITEIGASLYEVDPTKNEWRAYGIPFSKICWEESYPLQAQEVVDLTGLTDSLLKSKGVPPREALCYVVKSHIERADVILAHNASFDKAVLEAACERYFVDLPDKEWVCTLRNFPWPAKYACKKLGHLGWEHGLDAPASTLHRALDDVELMLKLVQRYDFHEVLKYARTPWVYLRGEVAGPWIDGGVQNTIAKNLGFAFESVRGDEKHRWPKTWVARVKQGQEPLLMSQIKDSKSPFRVSIIEGITF
jgi:hypothetical protein